MDWARNSTTSSGMPRCVIGGSRLSAGRPFGWIAGAGGTGQRPAAAGTGDQDEQLLVEEQRKDEGGHDGGIGLDDVLRRVGGELAPRDLLIGDGAGVGAVARRRIADLAEDRKS